MIKLVESPREAMQSLPFVIPTNQKVRYLNTLLKVGFDTVELGSIVSPRLIPQLADTYEVLKLLDFSGARSNGMALVVNREGAELVCGIDGVTHLCYPYSISPAFLHKNLNSTPEKAMLTVDTLLNIGAKRKRVVVIYISMGFGNPYGDPWSLESLMESVSELEQMGTREITLSNVSVEISPELIREVYFVLIPEFPAMEFGLHLHTSGMWWEGKVEAALGAGCRIFDSVIHGIGGCPMTGQELLGNLRTEDLVKFLNARNVPVNLDSILFEKSLELASDIFKEN
ncbi:MAG: hydroxymethylglutaryl-CoA lyase [bacterium]